MNRFFCSLALIITVFSGALISPPLLAGDGDDTEVSAQPEKNTIKEPVKTAPNDAPDIHIQETPRNSFGRTVKAIFKAATYPFKTLYHKPIIQPDNSDPIIHLPARFRRAIMRIQC